MYPLWARRTDECVRPRRIVRKFKIIFFTPLCSTYWGNFVLRKWARQGFYPSKEYRRKKTGSNFCGILQRRLEIEYHESHSRQENKNQNSTVAYKNSRGFLLWFVGFLLLEVAENNSNLQMQKKLFTEYFVVVKFSCYTKKPVLWIKNVR